MIIFPLPGESREDFLCRYDEMAKRLGYPATPPEWRKLFVGPTKGAEQATSDAEEDNEDVEKKPVPKKAKKKKKK